MKITLKQLRPLACHTMAHCHTCRTDADWRERVTGVRDFDCPDGWTEKKLPIRGAGDAVAWLTKKAGVKPCGKCSKRQDKLNRIFPLKRGSKEVANGQ